MVELILKKAIFTETNITIKTKKGDIIIQPTDIKLINYQKKSFGNFLQIFGETYPGYFIIYLKQKINGKKSFLIKLKNKEYFQLPLIYKAIHDYRYFNDYHNYKYKQLIHELKYKGLLEEIVKLYFFNEDRFRCQIYKKTDASYFYIFESISFSNSTKDIYASTIAKWEEKNISKTAVYLNLDDLLKNIKVELLGYKEDFQFAIRQEEKRI